MTQIIAVPIISPTLLYCHNNYGGSFLFFCFFGFILEPFGVHIYRCRAELKTYESIKALNKLRYSRGLSTFKYRPHAGEAGDMVTPNRFVWMT
jgi:hypothetical protein